MLLFNQYYHKQIHYYKEYFLEKNSRAKINSSFLIAVPLITDCNKYYIIIRLNISKNTLY